MNCSPPKKGKLIVIDGLDGSGKTTQFEMLLKKLSSDKNVRGISFPDYAMPSSTLVKMYLNGDFSKNAADVNAYAASTFYAADRYASYKLCWEKDYNNGCIIIASRYVCSNAIHQMSKLCENEWDAFLDWLCDYEYNKLGLPHPDKTILLDIPAELSQQRLTMRYKGDESRKDIHESNIRYMEKCRICALYAAKARGWSIIPCCSSDQSEIYTPEQILQQILDNVNEVISENA